MITTMATNALATLEDMVTCSTCSNKFEGRDTRCLPCLHPFCFECIKNFHSRTATSGLLDTAVIVCPKCQRANQLPGGQIENLPSYFQASQISDILNTLKQDHNLCMACSRNSTAMAYCFTCARTMCSVCQKEHDGNDAFGQHIKVPVDQTSVRSLVCSTHDDLVHCYCVDCQKPICRQCRSSEHNQHQIQDFTLSDGCVTAHGMYSGDDRSRQLIQRIRDYKENFDKHVEETIQHISRRKSELISRLTQEEADLRGKLYGNQITTHQSIDALLARTEPSRIRQPFPLLKTIEVQVPNPAAGMFQSENALDRALPVFKRYHFLPGTNDILLGSLRSENDDLRIDNRPTPTCPPMGVIEDVPPPSYAEVTRPSHGAAAAAADSRDGSWVGFESMVSNVHISDSLATPDCSRLVWRVSTKGTVHSLDFLPNGNIVTVEDRGWDSEVHHYALIAGLTLNKLFPLIVRDPDGLAVHHPSGKVVTRTEHSDSVALYTPNGTTYTTWKRKVNSPQGIAFMPDETAVIGKRLWTSSALTRVQLNGNVLWEKEIRHSAHYFAVDSMGRIIVTEQSPNGEVRVYSPEGKFIFKFPTISKLLEDPRGICVDSANRILVADRKKDAILLFSSDGQFIRKVLHFDGPKYVALYRDRYLAVAKTRKGLSMYEVNLL